MPGLAELLPSGIAAPDACKRGPGPSLLVFLCDAQKPGGIAWREAVNP